MENPTTEMIKKHFLNSSGGFPPDSPQEIFAYVETAAPASIDPIGVHEILRDWMESLLD